MCKYQNGVLNNENNKLIINEKSINNYFGATRFCHDGLL